MADELKAQMTQLEAAVAEYKLKHGKMPGEEPEPFSVRLQQDNLELIQQKRELRARIAALEAENARLREDAERWRMVPAFLEKYQLDYVGLLADIDAARREKT